MITNLPLLFVKGKPASLKTMSMHELECFITFLVHCSLGHDTVKNIEQPLWWPSNVPFSDPFLRPSVIPKDWPLRLIELIQSCYKHHCSEFLLKFCEELSKNPPSTLHYIKHCDSTTSLYLKSTNRLLVTFRNENMLYDEPNRTRRKCLMPYRQTPMEAEVESEGVNIYLCDTCDQVFDKLDDVQEHEKLCSQQDLLIPSPPSPDKAPLAPEPELIEEDDQTSFLRIFGLHTKSSKLHNTAPIEPEVTVDVRRNETRQKRRQMSSLSHFPFSSPAGRRINKTQLRTVDACLKREHLDRYCCTPANSDIPKWLSKHSTRHFPVKYKRPESYWTRVHEFPDQRNKFLLNLESQLLSVMCKPMSVVLNRLTINEIESHTKNYSSDHFDDNDIEFVSHMVLPENLRVSIVNKRKGRKTSKRKPEEKKTSSNDVKISSDIIDLCSDDEEECDVAHPSPVVCHAASDVVTNGLVLATTPEFLQPLTTNPKLEGAQYRISVQSSISQLVEDDEGSDSSPINNVISLD